MIVSHRSVRAITVSFRARARLLIGSGLGALAIVAAAQPAFANDECGSAASGSVVCPAANNPYANGVTYIAPPLGLKITVNSDTVIDTSGNAHAGLTALLTGTQSVKLHAAPGSTIVTDGAGAFGVVLATDSGGITATTSIVKTSGAGATGIQATSATGNITLIGGTTTTTGINAGGISAITNSGAIDITTGTVITSGANAVGASARSNSGNVTITVGAIGTSGAGSVGAIARTGGAGAATIQGGTISVTGTDATGASVKSATGAATVNLVSVKTRGANADGINVTSTGGTASVTATRVLTNGDNASGIVVSGAQGASVTYGTISTTGAGATGILIPAGPVATAKATVTGTGALTTTGANADAMNVNATGAVTIAATGTIGTIGNNSRGVVANGGGAVNVSTTGVTTTGTTSAGVVATSTGSSVRVVLAGTNSSATSDGVTIVAATSAVLDVAAGGSLNGGANGATITSGTTTKVNNAGTLNGAAYALVANGGAVTLNNAGTLNGRIALTDNADVVNNSGVFNATGVSLYGAGNDQFNNSGTYLANAGADFGAGADTFTNTGTFRVLGASASAGTITLAGLEAYNNSGLIDLRNGHAGDVLVLPGTYTGTGSAMLNLDVNPGGAGANTDQLRIGGAASGSTQVTLTTVGTNAAVLGTSAVLVQAGAGSSANAFTLANANVDQGLIQYGIVYNPTTFAYNLVGAPGVGVYRTAIFGEAVRNLWLQSGDAWTGHMRELRDNIAANGTGGAGGRVWAQTLGQVEQRKSSRTVTNFGITTQADVGYKQDYFGGQMGVDFGGGGFAFGITAGYLNSNLNFANSADRMNFDDVNGGVYANYSAGGFFLNALAKYDHYWGSTKSLTGRYSRDLQGSVYGGKAEVGFRFGTSLFVEPAASVSYTHTDMDDFTLASGSFGFDAQDGVRGKGGARIGYVTQIGAAKVSFYGGGNYVHEFKGQDRVAFVSGGQTVLFSNNRIRDYGEGTLGLNIGSEQGKISGFFEGRYADGGDYEGYGGRAGVRLRL
ncbi:MAG: autotransporter domain-containing protein [Sphingomonas sp.]